MLTTQTRGPECRSQHPRQKPSVATHIPVTVALGGEGEREGRDRTGGGSVTINSRLRERDSLKGIRRITQITIEQDTGHSHVYNTHTHKLHSHTKRINNKPKKNDTGLVTRIILRAIDKRINLVTYFPNYVKSGHSVLNV